jgi:YesN/AraC family two-component response regulator
MDNHFNILVIDDEQVIIGSIIKIASLEDFSVDTALSGKIAFEKLNTADYDLIISDIMLPEMDGFQILSKIESMHIDTPVIMTTGYSTIENAVKSLYMGAIDFIPKPFTIDEMISLIHRGMRYSKILRSRKNNEPQILLVPGPAKYSRLGYSCWMNAENDGSVLIGATDFFIKTVEPVKKIELLDVGEVLTQASYCVKFSSDDETIHQLYSVLSGNIIERNEKVIEQPELVEKDPYFEGWLYRIIPSEFDYEMKKLIPCSSDRS